MKINDAIEVLRKHNEWRRYSGEIDKSPEMTDPATLGKAIDTVVEHFADESEDERIRKGLLKIFTQSQNGYWAGMEIKDIVAWLETQKSKEKQKEQKLTAEEVLIKAGLKPYRDGNQWCILAGNNIQEGICGFGDTIEDALYQFLLEILEIQSEHKPRKFKLGDKVHWRNNDTNVLTITGFQDGAYLTDSEYGPIPFYDENNWERVEQKPSEKQDYSGLTDFERAIYRGFLCAGVENVPVEIIKETAQDCLAQIKPAEWSEKHIADVFEKVGLSQIVREQGYDTLNNAVQSAMIELSKIRGYSFMDLSL